MDRITPMLAVVLAAVVTFGGTDLAQLGPGGSGGGTSARPTGPDAQRLRDQDQERQRLMAQERERLQQRQQVLDGELNQIRERERLIEEEQSRLQEQLRLLEQARVKEGGQ